MPSTDVVSAFQALGIDTQRFNSGKHYVKCPSPECTERKKKNNRTLLLDFETSHFECFHCHWKGFANQSNGHAAPAPTYEAPPRKPQKYIDEPQFNWMFPDTRIDPLPPDPRHPEGQYDVTFYFRNLQGRITAAKKMAYNFKGNEMRRDKDKTPLFLGTRDDGYYPCLFNEHALTENPNATVILVESEKTAIFLTHKLRNYQHEFVFVASGGAQGLNDEKIPALKNRTVWIVYDCDNGELQPDGSVKNSKGREGAEVAFAKLEKICHPRIIDINPGRSDGMDLADILPQVNIDYIRQLPELMPEKIKAMWDDLIIREAPPYTPPLIKIQGVGIMTASEHSMIIGKQKTRKTLFIVQLVKWFFDENPKSDEREIVIFDTEQGKSHVYAMTQKIKKLTGRQVTIFYLRGKSCDERKEIISDTLTYWPVPIKVAFIDGVRDLMSNINDPDESTRLILWIERLILKHAVHISNVLHLNKTDSNARGHIGTELLNKAQTTIELSKDEKSDSTIVKCEYSRDMPFDDFGFTHDEQKMPLVTALEPKKGEIDVEDQKNKLFNAFEGRILNYKELTESITQEFDCSERRAKTLIAQFTREKWVMKDGIRGSKTTKYKLLLGGNGHDDAFKSPQIDFVPQTMVDTPQAEIAFSTANGKAEEAEFEVPTSAPVDFDDLPDVPDLPPDDEEKDDLPF